MSQLDLSKERFKQMYQVTVKLETALGQINRNLQKLITLAPLKKNTAQPQTKQQSKNKVENKSIYSKPKAKADTKSQYHSKSEIHSRLEKPFDVHNKLQRVNTLQSQSDIQELSQQINDISKNKKFEFFVDQQSKKTKGKGKHEQIVFNEKQKSVKSKKSAVKVKKIDVNKPKPPLSAFFLFMREKRDDVKKQFPDLTPKQLAILMGKLWGNLTPEQKKPYQQNSNRSHTNYKIFMSKRGYREDNSI